MAGIAYVIESYGIIVNTTLLAEAGYSVEDIQSFEDLKTVAEDITARKGELGFSAFTSAGMDSSSDWRFKTHLANLPIYFEYQDKGINSTDAIEGTYLDQYRAVWDLYINNATCDPAELTAKTANDALNDFVTGQAVFYQNGSWEYANVVGEGKLSDEDVTMIPLYFGVGDEANQGLCTGSENYWCVNKNASEENIQATLDFMYWCVTDETALQAITGSAGAMPSGEAGMGFAIPFKAAPESSNPFVALDAEMTAAGKTPISWNFTTMPSEEWKNMVGSALAVYAADQTDANWDAVVSRLRGQLGHRVSAGQRLSLKQTRHNATVAGLPELLRQPPFFPGRGVLPLTLSGQAARLAERGLPGRRHLIKEEEILCNEQSRSTGPSLSCPPWPRLSSASSSPS